MGQKSAAVDQIEKTRLAINEIRRKGYFEKIKKLRCDVSELCI